MDRVKRSYRSPRREAQAARTREAVVDAARRLLRAEAGRTGATMEAIAAEAGVSVQTVYATFGSKAAILIALLDRLEEAAAAGGPLPGRGTDPASQVRSLVSFHRRLFEQGADVIAAGLGAVATDPDLAAHVDTGHRRRRAAQAGVVEDWHRRGALRAGLSRGEAADVLWALTSPDLYLLHVRGSGWTPARYARWLSRALHELLLAP
jgi:AcrR family transcriptional regulator